MPTKKRGSYRTHTQEFKDQAAKMVLEQKRRKAEVARELEISPSLLDDWIEKFLEGSTARKPRGESKSSSDKERIRQLERENERLKMERDILKKAAAYFAKESE